jgi:hypothetical protein
MTTCTLTLDLDPITTDWLVREAAAAGREPAEFVAELLRELADPENVEGDLIDQLLADTTRLLPPVMTLDEHAEMKDELLDHLCHRVAETFREHLGMPMSVEEQAAFRQRLEDQSKIVWG